MSSIPFHRYDDMPQPNSKVQVPRISEQDAKALAAGKNVVNEIEMIQPGVRYSVREYRDPATGESLYIGGDFSSWE